MFLGFVGGIIGLLLMVGKQFSSPYNGGITIDLSFWSLPKYTMLSLGRGFAAYFLSLVFTLIYGTIAAHNHRAEKLMIPALDVLQAIPVLGFLPGLVLAMVSLFPTRELGLELACVVMIFTAQVWNMTFSFHGSLRGIPTPLREVAAIQGLSGWQVFKLLEVPASMIGLVWNSMMSMAGGWFFLTVNEAFTLGNKDYRLPGIGSYMNQAINDGDTPAYDRGDHRHDHHDRRRRSVFLAADRRLGAAIQNGRPGRRGDAAVVGAVAVATIALIPALRQAICPQAETGSGRQQRFPFFW